MIAPKLNDKGEPLNDLERVIQSNNETQVWIQALNGRLEDIEGRLEKLENYRGAF